MESYSRSSNPSIMKFTITSKTEGYFSLSNFIMHAIKTIKRCQHEQHHVRQKHIPKETKKKRLETSADIQPPRKCVSIQKANNNNYIVTDYKWALKIVILKASPTNKLANIQ